MNKKIYSTTMVFCVLIVSFFAVCQETAAQECRIVRIQGMKAHSSIRLEPETVSINKGTCVIWLNRAAAQEVKVVFEDGKKCSSVSEAPVGFSLDHENCYITSWISFGGTSSLRFMEEGSYEYTMEGADMPRGKVKGTILVR